MISWWYEFGLLGQIFLCLGVPAALIMILQMVLLLIGMGQGAANDSDTSGIGDSDGDMSDIGEMDGDFDASFDAPDGDDFDAGVVHSHSDGDAGLTVFTVRGIVTFFALFGWGGLACLDLGAHPWVAVVVGFIVGALGMVGSAWVLKKSLKLATSGNIEPTSAVGKTATVYLRIPPARQGNGKVNLLLGGAWLEMSAVTDDAEGLSTGCQALVIGVTGGTTLVVTAR